MTGFTTLDAHRGVLEDERPAFIGMALQTRLCVLQRLFHKRWPQSHPPSGRERTVWIVAVGALHESFVDAVLDRHGELRANRLVATITEIDLLLGQQKFGNRRLMDGVAVGTDDVRLGMLRTADIGAREIFRVAREAGIKHLGRLHERECPDGRFASTRFHMGFSWTVTAFTARAIRRLFAGDYALVVRVLEEIEPDVRVTGFTNVIADVIGRRRLGLGWRLSGRLRRGLSGGVVRCLKRYGRNQEKEPPGHFFNIDYNRVKQLINVGESRLLTPSFSSRSGAGQFEMEIRTCR
jgi:hypothetical protein